MLRYNGNVFIGGAFHECPNLTDVVLGKNVGFDVDDFFECDKLKEIMYQGTRLQWAKNIANKTGENVKVGVDKIICSDGIYGAKLNVILDKADAKWIGTRGAVNIPETIYDRP